MYSKLERSNNSLNEVIFDVSMSLKSIGFCFVPGPNLLYLSFMILRNSSNDFGDNPASL